MVKKNLVNKNVVRALSIGLSLAMASQPMMAMAAGENGNNDEPTGEVVAQPTASEVAAAEAKSDTTNAAMTSAINETQGAVNEVNIADRVYPREIEKDVKTASGQLAGEFDNNGGTPWVNDVQEEKDRLQKDAQDIADKEDDLDSKADVLDEKAEAANEQAEIADGAVADADTLLTDLEGKLASAESKFEEGKSELGTAIANEDQAAANAAYNKAAEAVEDAKTAVATAQEDYDQIKEKYDTAKEAYDTLVGEYDDLYSQYQDAVSEYERYKEAADGESTKLFDELGALKTKVENLEKAAKAARERVQSAKENLEGTKSEVDSTLETLKNNQYAQLKALEDQLKLKVANNYNDWYGRPHNTADDPKFINDDGSLDGTYTEYIAAVIQLYYVPDVLKGKDATITWSRNAENPELDYAEVTYTDKDGQPATVRLNGKLVNGNDEHKFGGLVIYEKYEDVTVTEDVYKAGNIDITDEIDKVKDGEVLVDTEDNLLIAKRSDDEYVYADGNGIFSPSRPLPPNQYYDEERETSYVYENGKIKKIVTADVYETQYDKETLTLKGEATYENEAAARTAYIAAVQAEIDKLGKGDTLTIGSGPAAKVYKYGDTATDAGFKKTGGEKADIQDGFEMTATYYKEYTEEIARVYSKNVIKDKNGNVVDTEYYSSKKKAEDAGRNYWNSLNTNEKNALIAEIIESIGTQGYVEDVSFIDYEGAPARSVYNTNTATAYSINEVKIKAVERDGGWAYELIVAKDSSFVECEAIERTGHISKKNGNWKWDETPEQFADRVSKLGYVLEIKDDVAYIAPKASAGTASKVVVVVEDKDEMSRLNRLIDDNNVTTKEAVEFANLLTSSVLNADAAEEQANGDHRKVVAFGTVVQGNTVKAHMTKVTSPFGFATVNAVKKTEKAVLVEEDHVISTTVWTAKNVQKTEGQRIVKYTDQNYYNADVLFGTEFKLPYYEADYTTDKPVYWGDNTNRYFDFHEQAQSIDYRNKLDGNQREIERLTGVSEDYGRQIDHKQKLIEQYQKIENQAKKAQEKVVKAQERVEYIQGLLEDLDYDRDLVAIQELESDLEAANTRLLKAIERRDALVDALKELSVPTFGGGEGGGEPGGDEGTGTGDETPTIGGVLPAPVLLGGAPAGFIGGGGAPAAAGEGDGTVELTEPQTALAAEVPEETTEQPQLSNLQTPETPLAAAPINEETLSWWWLLIIAVLGGAGYAMYKKFQTKKDEKTTN